MPNLISIEDIDNDYQEQFSINEVDSKVYNPHKMNARKFEHIIIAENYSYIYLQDKNQEDIISKILLRPKIIANKQYYEIYWTFSKNKQKGDLSYLFKILTIELKLQIISDKEQTFPGAKDFWVSLSRKKFVNINRIDLSSNYRRNYKNYKEYEIWGLEGHKKIKGFESGYEFNLNSNDELKLTIDDSFQEPDSYEIYGLEDIDNIILDEINTKSDLPNDSKDHEVQSIEEYRNKYGKLIRDCESIRLIAKAK